MLAGLEFGQQLLDVLLNLGFAMNVSRCIYVNLSKGRLREEPESDVPRISRRASSTLLQV